VIHKNIERAAEKLIQDNRVSSYPIPVDRIASAQGLKVTALDDLGQLNENVSGVLILDNGNGLIGFNSSETKVRQRFTIAHEIGHFMLHCGDQDRLFVDNKHTYRVEFRDANTRTGTDIKEQQANAFAAALLMPTKFLLKEIDEHHLDMADEDSLLHLAEKFEVSTMAMSFRIANLGLFSKSPRIRKGEEGRLG
jgi:Zn-dependent peptidase ImmA (M78 family)